jgi:hypothetical protein
VLLFEVDNQGVIFPARQAVALDQRIRIAVAGSQAEDGFDDTTRLTTRAIRELDITG